VQPALPGQPGDTPVLLQVRPVDMLVWPTVLLLEGVVRLALPLGRIAPLVA